ncbi:alpha/beta hydrolase [Candidatus Saccharibacteria bacterium]|nr:alpha/beta hydrolase [Candidatus Saccharibacteria bacterium]
MSKLFYYSNGEGPPVLLVHGFYASHHYLSYVYERLEDHQVIVPDLLGFGSSPKPAHGDYSAEAQSQLIKEVIEELKIDQPLTIVGHSMGGIISLFLAGSLKPEQVKTVIVLNTPIYPNRQAARDKLSDNNEDPEEVLYGRRARMAIESNVIVYPIVKAFSKRISKVWHRPYPVNAIADVTSCNWASYSGSLKGVMERQDEIHEFIAQMADKIKMVSGSDDPFRSLETEQAIVAKYPHIEWQELEAGHHTPVEIPEKIAEIIKSYL